jgi:hypothetical protein
MSQSSQSTSISAYYGRTCIKSLTPSSATISCGQENDLQGRQLVLGRVRHLHQGVRGHWSITSPTSSCLGPSCSRRNMLSNHLARLQRHSGQGQEAGVHTLWFPCRFLLGKRHHSSQTRKVDPAGVQIPDRTIPQT